MKTLRDILAGISTKEVIGSLEKEIEDIQVDSRRAGRQSLFVAIKGTQVDGHQFIDKVEARAVLCEQMPIVRKPEISYIRVENSRDVLGFLAANFYDRPAEELTVVGVTGTNGKTSVCTLLHTLFMQMGEKSGLISTISYHIGNEVYPSTHTTPNPLILQRFFREMVEQGCNYCFMEVSSHALDQARVNGIPFQVGVFMNITHDHLDYHGDFASYIKAKKLLFDGLGKQAVALVNQDDRNGQVMLQNTKALRKSFSMRSMADYQVRLVENTLEGLNLEIEGQSVWVRLLGAFNAYNLLAVYAVAMELDYEREEVLREMSLLKGVAGRFERVTCEPSKLRGIVDYAHTPDALENVYTTLKAIPSDGSRLISVLGCGGDRDREKRPKMGALAAKYSDEVILTSDNPRSEEPQAIIAEMYEGIPVAERRKVLQVSDRREAIKLACRIAQDQDIVLVAGKGHEAYQEIKGVRYPFDDVKELRSSMKDQAG